MTRVVQNTARWLAIMVPCVVLSIPCWGAPPPGKSTFPAQASRQPAHLDLRPPAVRENAPSGTIIADSASSNRSRLIGMDDSRLAPLANGMNQSREMGRVETFARRFRREGLPVARLWEGHSALVSLGLNSHGKPGLWLVQKTH
jgi:hypothetical protein